MKKIKYLLITVFVLLGAFLVPSLVGATESTKTCSGIKLNTNVPFVGNCIAVSGSGTTTPINAFPKLMGSMMNLLMTVILIMSLLLIVYAGVLMTMEGSFVTQKKGIGIIQKVAVGMALLGASGVILKIINPNFFT